MRHCGNDYFLEGMKSMITIEKSDIVEDVDRFLRRVCADTIEVVAKRTGV